MAAPGRSRFVYWNITRVSLWLLCATCIWGYVKNLVFVTQLPRDLADLKARIIAAVKNIDAPMSTRVWQELEYRIDVCRVTRDANFEHISCKKKNTFSVFL